MTGSIVGDESYFDHDRVGPGWKSSFFRSESPPLSALSVDRAATRTGMARRPSLVAAQRFRKALRTAGITVRGEAKAVRAGGRHLAFVFSPTLSTMLHEMDRDSDNYEAEELLKVLGAHATGLGTSLRGAAVIRRVLRERRIPQAGVWSLTAPAFLARPDHAPRAGSNSVGCVEDPALRPAFVGALAVAGRDGTLRHRFLSSPARGVVHAKTGTTDEASALSGFVRGHYVFVIIENGSPVSTWAAHEAQDRFVTS